LIARLHHRLRAEGERGLTMVELLVAAIITGFILVLVATFFVQVTRVTTTSVQTGNSSQIASTAMFEISNVIHQATTIPVNGGSPLVAVNTANINKLVIYALVDVDTSTNPVPSRVTFDASSGEIIETRCAATASGAFWTFSTCSSTKTRDIGGVVQAPNVTMTPPQNTLFSYLDSNGNPIALSSGSVPPASIPSIASIQVSVNILAPKSTTAPVYITSNVGMPNLGLQIATP
jgi:type II secretory pathway pseudopilin PulG